MFYFFFACLSLALVLEAEKFKSMTLASSEDLPAILQHNRRHCRVIEPACQLTFSSSYKDVR